MCGEDELLTKKYFTIENLLVVCGYLAVVLSLWYNAIGRVSEVEAHNAQQDIMQSSLAATTRANKEITNEIKLSLSSIQGEQHTAVKIQERQERDLQEVLKDTS